MHKLNTLDEGPIWPMRTRAWATRMHGMKVVLHGVVQAQDASEDTQGSCWRQRQFFFGYEAPNAYWNPDATQDTCMLKRMRVGCC